MTQLPVDSPEAGQEKEHPAKGRNRPRGKARQAAKRATFPLINSHIIAVADTGNLNLLVSTIEVYVSQMNLVNISTALHRLAKLTAAGGTEQALLRQHPVLSALLQSAAATLARAEIGGATPHCQALSNITWSMATIQYVDMPLLEMVAALACKHVSGFKPFELSSTLWAFAKLGSTEPAACDCALPLFEVAAEVLLDHADDFTFRCLVMAAWAFATARQHDIKLFRGIAQKMVPMVHTANCQELANTAWAFSTAGVQQDRLFAELARKAVHKLGEFKAQELSNMLWSFAANGFFHEEFVESAALAVQFLDLNALQLANIMWALTRSRARHRTTHATVLALLPRCTRLLGTFKPQELSCVALAAAKCFGRTWSWPPQEMAPPGFSMFQQVTDFLTLALPHIVPCLADFSGQSLANVATSYLAFQMGADLFPALGCEVMQRARSLENSALLLLLRGLPSAPQCGQVVQVLFREAACRVDSMRPKEMQVLSRIVTSFLGRAKSGSLAKIELQKACLSLAEATSWVSHSPHGLEEALFDPAPHPNAAGSDDEEPQEEASKNLLEPCKVQTSAPASEVGNAEEESSASSARPIKNLDVPVPYSVKNTFLHVEDDGEAAHQSQNDEPEITLPPSLDIIPASVSAEKLEAYRKDYLKFRTGKAIGAKGELSSSVASA